MTAQVPRVEIYERFCAGNLLDRGPVSLRHQDIVIDRTRAAAAPTSRAYAFFAQRVALNGEQVRATQRGTATIRSGAPRSGY